MCAFCADRSPDRDVGGRRTLVAPAPGDAEDLLVRWLLGAGDAVVRHDREEVSARRFRAWVDSTDTP